MTCSKTKVNSSEVKAALWALFREDTNGWIEVRSVPPERSAPHRAWFQWEDPKRKDYEETASAISEYLEKQDISGKANVYIGRSLRDESGGGGARDVSCVQTVTLDIDPVRADKTKPATLGEYEASLKAAEVVAAAIEHSYGKAAPAIVRSGNGTQLWYRLQEPVDVRGRRRWWESGQRTFEELLRALVEKYGCTMDTQWDLPRVVKLPGTLSVKGSPDAEHPHRMATISPWDMTATLNPKYIFELAGNELDKEARPFESLEASKTIPGRFWVDVNRYPRLLKAWSGTLTDIPDRSPSAQDMALARILAGLKYLPEQSLAILTQSPGGNPEKRNREDYLRLTIQKAYS